MPTSIDLLAVSDTGSVDDDNLTRLNNADSASTLQFLVSGVTDGAEVRILADGVVIGSAVAAGETAIVTTDGVQALADGVVSITAVQVFGGTTDPSDSLEITIDATAPEGLTNQAPELARVGEAYTFDAESPEEGSVVYSLEDAPDGMTIDAATGEISWTPSSDQTVPQTFQIVQTDEAGNATSESVSLTVLGAIQAYPDDYSVDEDTSLAVAVENGVLANDDTTQGTLTTTVIDQPAHGAVTLNSDGSLEYTPDENFCGTDTFTYQATNGEGDESNVALVTIFVNAVNDAPVAVEDSYVASEGGTLIVTADEGVLSNDSDVDGDSLASELVDDPSHGTITLYSDGSFSYVPEAGFYGEDSFTYKTNDGTADSETVSVLITVAEDITDLGAVDYLLLSQLDLTSATLTYSLQTTHDGFLTFEALFSDTTGSVSMTLLDGDGNELAVSSVASGGQRIDWETLADVSYTLKLSGDLSAVDLRIANLVHLDGTTVTVYGTAEADTFLFSAESGRNVTINDVLYAFGNDEVSEVVFDADKTDTDTASDIVWIEGSDLAETLTATFEGEDLVPTMVFETNEGAAQPFTVTATNFEQLLAWSRSGEADTAVFEDSPGQDKAKALPGENASLIRNTSGYTSFYRRAKLFEEVTFVGANSPEGDTVIFFDTSGSDLFEANGETGEHRLVAETGQVCAAEGFSELLVRSIYDGDTDTATFVGSSQNDKFVARPAKARMYSLIEGYEYDVIVRDFDVAEVDFSNGGTDVARLADSARSDHFEGTSTECTFTAVSYTFTVKQADMVTVTSLNADDGDTAEIYDTDGDDMLQAGYDGESASTVELWTPDKDGDLLFQLVGIESVDAYGTTGTNRAHIAGTDFVQLHGLWDKNSAADVQDDSYEVDEDGELTIDATQGVLANDSDADGDTLTATLITSPAHGTVTLDDDGSFTYTPETDFWGTDTFTYVANDGFGDSTKATVSITVNAVNDGAPVATEDSYSVSADTSLTVDAAAGLLANDTDVDGDALSATLASSPANGSVSLNTDGSFTYTPDAEFHGTDSFTYIANDGTEGSAVTTVTIDVNSPAAPVEDAYSVDEDNVLTVAAASGVLANDDDVDGDSMTATLVTAPTHGVLTFNGDGSFIYTPDEDFWGSDTFTYVVDDGYAVSTEATVSITVNPVNDAAPVAADDAYEVAVNGNVSVDAASGILANDSDEDGDPMTVSIVSEPTGGTLTLNTDGSFTYVANTDFHDTDSFTYVANDGTADSAEATVTIKVNTAPDPVDDSYTIVEDQVLSVDASAGLLANDSDSDGDSLTATLFSAPSHGTVTVNADGSFSYTPEAGYEGEDSFSYVVNDGFVSSLETAVTITVTPANDAPVAIEDAYVVPVNATLTVNSASGTLANDSDGNGDSLTAAIVTQPSNGVLTLNADGSFAYTPNADFHGTDTFTYIANDGTADSAETTVTIAVNTSAGTVADGYSMDEDGSLTVDSASGVLSNDSDTDGDTLSATLATAPVHGTLVFSGDGSFNYTPTADFSGTDEFTYVADDGFGDSVETTVTITVNAVNDLPVAVTDSYSVDEDNVLTVDAATGVLANDGDADGDTLNAVLISAPAHGTLLLNSDGSFTFTPMANYAGSDEFTYVANDDSGNSQETTVTITVNPVNDEPPVPVDDYYAVPVNGELTIDAGSGLLANDNDADGDPMTVSVATGPANGTLTLNADGSFTYTPNSDFHGTDTFTYVANDGTADSTEATVTIDVNTLASAVDDAYSVDEDNQLVVDAASGVLGNDSDADSDSMTVSLVTLPSHGDLTLNADGSFTYTPEADYHGADSFTYVVDDGFGNSLDATVTLTVNSVADAPIAEDDFYSVPTNGALNVDASAGVLVNDSDADGDSLTMSLVSGPANGVLSWNADGSFTYTPNADFIGTDTFTYVANDGTTDSVEATVTIDVQE